MKQIQSVAIVGGTHGNEYSGIFLLQQWQKHPQLINRDSFSSELLFANPQAYKNNTRYVDSDLNRQFLQPLLQDPLLTDYEQSRAKVINAQLGPKGSAKTDFIIDLHNTTSNMGPSLILLQSDTFNLQMAAYVSMKMPESVIILEDQVSMQEHPYLCAIAEQGVIVEIGPQPQSVLRQDVLQWMDSLTQHILDFIDLNNRGQLPELPDEFEAYSYTETVNLPEDENGQRLGMVHKNVQDRDFKAVKPGDPIISLFDGDDITWQGDYIAYPHFINEAAYYENNVAMSMAIKHKVTVPEN